MNQAMVLVLDKDLQELIHTAIKYIGHGFAKTIVIHTGVNIVILH